MPKDTLLETDANFKWLQRDSNLQSLSSQTNTQPFSQTGQMIWLFCEYFLYDALTKAILKISENSQENTCAGVCDWAACFYHIT